ncbi:von Willebrand factor C and EGF domain-containing protein-like isoform X2 [Biomphalaria glabrata]|nr:von Willebrand factor C and EGF domain-containing protein-like isoform X2 [Biomphalaria glabrata]
MKAVIALVALVSLGCVVAQDLPTPATSCEHNGVTYAIGESVPYDSCNNCRCSPYGLICTMMLCPEDYGRCYVRGQWYESGTRVPAPDGCNTCLCYNGELTVCTLMGCLNTDEMPLNEK